MKSIFLSLCVAMAAGPFASGAAAQSVGYTFTPLAGHPLFGSADGQGRAAEFATPRNVATDRDGNIFATDGLNNTIRKITRTGVVTTVAGQAGTLGSADGTGSVARFNLPFGIAVDPAGNIFVSDLQSHTIRRITPAGVVTTVAGRPGAVGATDGIGSEARFSSPAGLAFDRAGNLYVADMENNAVRKITPAGVVSTFAGRPGNGGNTDGPAAVARFNLPISVAADGTGNVYVVDLSYDSVRRISPTGEVTTIAGGPGGSTDGEGSVARFSFPIGLTADQDGNVYVADNFNDLIRKMTPAGVVTTLAGQAREAGDVDGMGSAARFDGPSSVAVDADGNVYVADPNNGKIRAIDRAGAVTTLAGGGSAGDENGMGQAARFKNPAGLAVDLTGNVYVADLLNSAIRKITPAGVVSTLVGAAGSTPGVDLPLGVAVDRDGNVYVADASSTVQKITPAGAMVTLAGARGISGDADGPGSAARFNAPNGLAVDPAGNVYVADQKNSTIRKITPTGVVTTIAGAANQRGGDDGLGRAARFVEPTGVALDVAGNLYVSDRGSYTVRKITPLGQVSTLAGLNGVSGVADGTGSEARFISIEGIATDRLGNVYVTEGNNLVRQITPDGVVTSIVATTDGIGKYPSLNSAGHSYFAVNVATDLAGDLYVTDSANNTVRRGVSTTRLVNLSVRTRVGTGDQTPFMGFVVNGPKHLLVRGIGPTLLPMGVTDATVDPQLTLFDFLVQPIQENDNWGGSAQLREAFAALGAFPLEAGSKDAASLATLDPGLYSARLAAAGAAGGVALLETYDADMSTTSRLTNMSVRSFAGTGDNTLIGGFVLAGSVPKTVLIRAAGPSLARHGLETPGLLADPRLTLFNGTTIVDTNDNRGGTPELKEAGRRVGAFEFDSDTSKDAALLVTLQPGIYTAHVTGANAGTGVALFEIYELP